MYRPLVLILIALLAASCTNPRGRSSDDDDDVADDDDSATAADDDDDSEPDDDDVADDDDTTPAGPPTTCESWNELTSWIGEGAWSGNVATCDAGDIEPIGRESAVALVNFYRELAGLDPVTSDTLLDAYCQDCALAMHANGDLNHSPPSNWDCLTDEGASAAGSSNLAWNQALSAIDAYMVDFGNASTMGHRRWLLSPSLETVGIGSTSQNSCMWVVHFADSAGVPWVAWPPPGEFPIEADGRLTFGAGSYTVDHHGWTFSSSSIGLSGAVVSVTEDGEDRPVRPWNCGTDEPDCEMSLLSGSYGAGPTISFLPVGWGMEPGSTYRVRVEASEIVEYDVEVVGCE
ncbi:MAG: CAP domain-containing protein [Proteobacteria bacterium]|nr:CAP domain-containing protein [Pseudomonadota bacterium]